MTFNLILERLKALGTLGKRKMTSVRGKRSLEERMESWDLRTWALSVSTWEFMRPLEGVITR